MSDEEEAERDRSLWLIARHSHRSALSFPVQPWPRTRKAVKWGGLVVSVLLVVVWTGSAWYSAGWLWAVRRTTELSNIERFYSITCSEGSLQVGRGMDYFAVDGPPLRPAEGWVYRTGYTRFVWRYTRTDTMASPGGHWYTHFFPLWPLVLLTLIPTALAWRLDTLARRRANTGKCAKCSYDFSGLKAGTACPECGTMRRAER